MYRAGSLLPGFIDEGSCKTPFRCPHCRYKHGKISHYTRAFPFAADLNDTVSVSLTRFRLNDTAVSLLMHSVAQSTDLQDRPRPHWRLTNVVRDRLGWPSRRAHGYGCPLFRRGTLPVYLYVIRRVPVALLQMCPVI